MDAALPDRTTLLHRYADAIEYLHDQGDDDEKMEWFVYGMYAAAEMTFGDPLLRRSWFDMAAHGEEIVLAFLKERASA